MEWGLAGKQKPEKLKMRNLSLRWNREFETSASASAKQAETIFLLHHKACFHLQHTLFIFIDTFSFCCRKTIKPPSCSERGTNCLWFLVGIKHQIVFFSFMSCCSLTQFGSIWKEQEKLPGQCLSVKLPAFRTNPAQTRTTSFASCLNLFPVSARVFAYERSVKAEQNFFFCFV